MKKPSPYKQLHKLQQIAFQAGADSATQIYLATTGTYYLNIFVRARNFQMVKVFSIRVSNHKGRFDSFAIFNLDYRNTDLSWDVEAEKAILAVNLKDVAQQVADAMTGPRITTGEVAAALQAAVNKIRFNLTGFAYCEHPPVKQGPEHANSPDCI